MSNFDKIAADLNRQIAQHQADEINTALRGIHNLARDFRAERTIARVTQAIASIHAVPSAPPRRTCEAQRQAHRIKWGY
jgi:hypothetical protein